MRTAYELAFGVCALDNVPSQGHDVAFANGQDIEAEHFTEVITTETWDPPVKDGIRAGCPGLDWWTEDGQSVMIGHDPTRVKVLERHILVGAASPRIPGVSDRRDVLIELHEDLMTHRRYWVVAVHTCPIPTKKAPLKVPVAMVAHQVARRRLRRWRRTQSRGYPILMAGDFNTRRLTGAPVRAGDKIGNGIVHLEGWDGRLAKLARFSTTTPVQLHSDHPGVRIMLKVFA